MSLTVLSASPPPVKTFRESKGQRDSRPIGHLLQFPFLTTRCNPFPLPQPGSLHGLCVNKVLIKKHTNNDLDT